MVKKKMQTYTQFLFQIGLSVSIRSLVKRTSKINLTCSDGHDGSANLLLGDAPLPTGTPVFFFFFLCFAMRARGAVVVVCNNVELVRVIHDGPVARGGSQENVNK